MIDHVGFNVRDVRKAREFYIPALSALGYEVIVTGATWTMLGRDGKPRFWFGTRGAVPGPFHIAFGARTRAEVDAFYSAAVKAGGRGNGGPGVRHKYHSHYYAAFVLDPDGNNVEAVCHTRDL